MECVREITLKFTNLDNLAVILKSHLLRFLVQKCGGSLLILALAATPMHHDSQVYTYYNNIIIIKISTLL